MTDYMMVLTGMQLCINYVNQKLVLSKFFSLAPANDLLNLVTVSSLQLPCFHFYYAKPSLYFQGFFMWTLALRVAHRMVEFMPSVL